MVKIILIIVAILVVSGGAFFYWTNKSSNTESSANSLSQVSTPTSSNNPTSNKENKIIVEDQSDGDILVISSLMLSKPGFVVLHKSTADGKPGTVVGSSSYLMENLDEELDIDISPIAKKGDTYFAMLHEDTNGNKKYDDEATDMPVKDSQGNVVMTKFTITESETAPSEE